MRCLTVCAALSALAMGCGEAPTAGATDDAGDANPVSYDASAGGASPSGDGGARVAAAPTVSLTVTPNPDNVVSAVATVITAGAASVTLRAVDAEGRVVETPALAVTGEAMEVPVLGLTPGGVSAVTAVARAEDGTEATSASVDVTLGAMPAEMPTVRVTARGEGSDYLLLSLLCWGTPVSVASVVDRDGRFLWYRRGGTPSTFGFEFQERSPGVYVMYQSDTKTFDEVDLTGHLRRTIALPDDTLRIDGHDIGFAQDGEAIVLGIGGHTADTLAFTSAGRVDDAVMDFSLAYLSADGASRTLWRSWPGAELSDTALDVFASYASPFDAEHPNAVDLTDDGAVLVSARHTDTVLKIDRASGAVRWRLGGARSDFAFVDDPYGGFSHQHDARQQPDGTILLWDNGNNHTPPASRAVRYRLDASARTATMVWQWPSAPLVYSGAAGSVRPTADGGALISYGINGQMVEVDSDGQERWRATAQASSACMVYRAVATDRLYADLAR